MVPKFTVIVPSYNGGEYLKQCVHSVLTQTVTEFDLAVLEDGSTDGSLQWLRDLHEPRLKIYPAPQNLGIVENWARAMEIPKGEYMTILGQDDLLDSNYLEVMDALIRREPEASLYFAHFRYIDESGHLISRCRPLPPRETAAEYIAALFSGARDTWGAGYMMRSALYDAVGGIPKYKKLLFADDALWITLMHKSWKATAHEECFSIRRHAESAGVTAGESWVDGMRSYITFLEKLSRRDPEVRRAYTAYGPGYFRKWCYDIYMNALAVATKNNQRLDAHLKEALLTQLARVSPQASHQLRNMKRVRLHDTINSNSLTRWLYQMYSCRRYGSGWPDGKIQSTRK